ncbi:hypothetical protein MNBD_ACTINO01-1919, partial [hydrothermal vent metagenome]
KVIKRTTAGVGALGFAGATYALGRYQGRRAIERRS